MENIVVPGMPQELRSVEEYQIKAALEEPEARQFLTSVYVVEYRADGAVHHKNFVYDGDLVSAIARAKQYCQTMRYRFIFCSPFLTDLEKNEKKMETFG
jgi:hypothetical protein